jgi:glycosyltransferase involved in cell wall biosynthesis
MADVCLILEGTYPYVSGGVSSWIYDIIKNMKDVSFSIVYLGAYSNQNRKQHYPIPSNVVDLREYFIFDYLPYTSNKGKIGNHEKMIFREFLTNFLNGKLDGFEDLLNIVRSNPNGVINLYDLLYSKDNWDFSLDFYDKNLKEYPFSNFFWSWNILLMPFLSLLRIRLPKSGVYHSVSTGYAGLLASIAKISDKRPFVLTEHGIYTRERKVDILHSQWIYTRYQTESKVNDKKDMIKELWINFFYYLSNLAYKYSDEIVSICEINKKIQIEEGASRSKIRVIPNGVDIPDLGDMFYKKIDDSKQNFKVCFVGRVVPIKDLKTFIRACGIVRQKIPNVEIEIIGPFDEDKEYFEECRNLILIDNLEDTIKFLGKVNLKEYYPKMDVVVFTSISEGQPLVILEASSYGIPVVSTDVGDCKGLLLGSTDADIKIGASGIITPLSNPDKTAEAIVRLYEDKNLYEQMSKNALTRVKKYYQKTDLIGSYRYIYNKCISEI